MPALPDLQDLLALGLPRTPAEVLRLLGDEGWTTSVALAARLGVSRSVVSAAVDVLVEAGLVTRVQGRKPAPLRLHPDVDLVLTGRLTELAAEREAQAQRAERASAWVRSMASRCATQPAPVHLLDPAGAPPDYRLATARETYDEVTRVNGTSVLFHAQVRRSPVHRRLLVLGRPADQDVAWLLRNGVVLRTTRAPLPVLLAVDRARARVEVSADGRSGRTAWTHDTAQVAALQQLFELWWQDGDPCEA